MEIKQQHIRNFLRVISGVILLAYLWDIVSNKIKNGKIYLDVNDGYIIIGCLAILLAIEAVRGYLKRRLGINSSRKNTKSPTNDDDKNDNGAVTPNKGF